MHGATLKKIIIQYLYEKAQHVSGDTPPIIRSLKLHLQPLFFVCGRLLDVRHSPTTSTNCTSD